jgi:hypothetical protein
MSTSRDAVRCTVRDGEMWIHLDDISVKIPERLLNKSEVLTDAVSVAEPSVTRKITLAAPKEWLQAWVLCYCDEEESLKSNDIAVLVNCLLVCFLRLDHSFHPDQNRYVCLDCVHSVSTSRLNASSLPDSLNLIMASF